MNFFIKDERHERKGTGTIAGLLLDFQNGPSRTAIMASDEAAPHRLWDSASLSEGN